MCPRRQFGKLQRDSEAPLVGAAKQQNDENEDHARRCTPKVIRHDFRTAATA